MVTVAPPVMMGIAFVSIRWHLIRIALAMVKRAGSGGIDAPHPLRRVRDRAEPERQHEHKAEEQGGQPVHRPRLAAYVVLCNDCRLHESGDRARLWTTVDWFRVAPSQTPLTLAKRRLELRRSLCLLERSRAFCGAADRSPAHEDCLAR